MRSLEFVYILIAGVYVLLFCFEFDDAFVGLFNVVAQNLCSETINAPRFLGSSLFYREFP
jgi:hypothetical protein